mmetsp:Transcript_79004/g.189733  ORF Transcript_79004/g.189733 Transcript_79004/m.189733 type:complete len:89 (+) Transcript_79004:1354-1620(+)
MGCPAALAERCGGLGVVDAAPHRPAKVAEAVAGISARDYAGLTAPRKACFQLRPALGDLLAGEALAQQCFRAPGAMLPLADPPPPSAP